MCPAVLQQAPAANWSQVPNGEQVVFLQQQATVLFSSNILAYIFGYAFVTGHIHCSLQDDNARCLPKKPVLVRYHYPVALVRCPCLHNDFLQGVFQKVHDLLIQDKVIHASQVGDIHCKHLPHCCLHSLASLCLHRNYIFVDIQTVPLT